MKLVYRARRRAKLRWRIRKYPKRSRRAAELLLADAMAGLSDAHAGQVLTEEQFRNELALPNPLRLRYRRHFAQVIQLVVLGSKLETTVNAISVPEGDLPWFLETVNSELEHLDWYNYARYRLTMEETQAWIDKGRPR